MKKAVFIAIMAFMVITFYSPPVAANGKFKAEPGCHLKKAEMQTCPEVQVGPTIVYVMDNNFTSERNNLEVSSMDTPVPLKGSKSESEETTVCPEVQVQPDDIVVTNEIIATAGNQSASSSKLE